MKGLFVLGIGIAALLSAAMPAAAGPAAQTLKSPQVVLDWNATAAATLIASGKPQPESTSTRP